MAFGRNENIFSLLYWVGLIRNFYSEYFLCLNFLSLCSHSDFLVKASNSPLCKVRQTALVNYLELMEAEILERVVLSLGFNTGNM